MIDLKIEADLSKVSQAIYLACEAEVAADVSQKINAARKYILELESQLASQTSASTKANHLRIKELEEQKAELLEFVKGLHSMNLAQILDKSVELYGKLK